MLLIDYYTSPENVRAALGVSIEELEDYVISLPYMMTLLSEDLRDISPSLPGILDPLLQQEDEGAFTADQKRFVELARLFVTMACARHLLDPAELFGFLKVADGRASTERTPDAYANLRVGIAGTLARVRGKLLEAFLVLEPSAPVPAPRTLSFVSSIGIAADPVTGT